MTLILKQIPVLSVTRERLILGVSVLSVTINKVAYWFCNHVLRKMCVLTFQVANSTIMSMLAKRNVFHLAGKYFHTHSRAMLLLDASFILPSRRFKTFSNSILLRTNYSRNNVMSYAK